MRFPQVEADSGRGHHFPPFAGTTAAIAFVSSRSEKPAAIATARMRPRSESSTFAVASLGGALAAVAVAVLEPALLLYSVYYARSTARWRS